MRKIEKAAVPEILTRNGPRWTDEYLTHLREGTAPSSALAARYKDPAIKAQIMAECFEKCAYCESKIRHVYPGDVEHIVPKARRPELIFDWFNLTFACAECNRRKRDYYQPDDPLIDPVRDNPSDYLVFMANFCFGRLAHRKGQLTTTLLELNRTDLFERRRERIQNLLPLFEVYSSEANPERKRVLLEQIRREAEPSSEYSVMVLEFLDMYLGTSLKDV